MLVIAGAGTGKTTVLTRRIAHLVREGHARPDEILAVTYTKNAAQEMRQRVAGRVARDRSLRPAGSRPFTTIATICSTQCGKKFGVVDDQDLWIYLRRRIRELNLNYFIRAASVSKFLDDLLDVHAALPRRTGQPGEIRRNMFRGWNAASCLFRA